jgi:succinate dehydrogenase/fumarate reductase flavoprotein subunit
VKEIKTDVLVIGSGVAGIMAALTAARMGCEVVLVSKLSLRSGNSGISAGAWIFPTAELTPDRYIQLIMKTGKEINNRQLVRVIAERGEGMTQRLRDMGLPLVRLADRYWTVETRGSRKGPGMTLVDGLLEHIRDDRIIALPWVSILDLVVDEGRASGAIGLSKTGDPVAIAARSVILATGGGGSLYRRNDNHGRMLGDGYWLALAAGLPLCDMEFVQFYPLALSEPRLPTMIVDEPFPNEARVVNTRGEDVVKKHGLPADLNEIANTCRDQLTLILAMEKKREDVYLDYTAVPGDAWQRPPLERLYRANPDFRHRPFSVGPAVHFFMGGVEIDAHAQTEISGLFAAGEVTSGVHGANRLGGNALAECLVFGEVAGESAARCALEGGSWKPHVHPMNGSLSWRDETGRARTLLQEVQDLMWLHAGPIRNAESLRKGVAGALRLESRLDGFIPEKGSVEHNAMKGSLLISKAIMRASLEREESRGAHYREDCPQRNDTVWLKHVVLRLDRKTWDLVVSHSDLLTEQQGKEGR